jgi:hypothetical protein
MNNLFRSRSSDACQTTRRRPAPRRPAAGVERLEPRALLAVTVPPDISSNTVELDDNVLVGVTGSIEATSGSIQIFGNSSGRIDAVTAGSGSLSLKATGAITVTGAIGAQAAFDSLTLWSSSGQPVNLQQAVTLDEDLTVTKAGTFTVGSTLTVGDDLTITDASTVLFAGNVNVAGDLTITNATSVTFAGTLTVGGLLTITNATGTTRFTGDVTVGGAAVTTTTLVQVLGGFTSTGTATDDGDVTFTAKQVNFATATIATTAAQDDASTATLVIRPRDAASALTIASPPGVAAGLSITDADIAAIQAGWKRVVFGDEAAGTGAVRIGSIGSQYGGYSQLLNTTSIVGGTIDVVQPVDVTALADYLELVARGTGTGPGAGITIDAPINQTAEERNDWIRLTSNGPITVKDPIWAATTVSLTTTGGGTVTQTGGTAGIDAASLAVDADGAATLADTGNAFTTVAIRTTNDDVVLVENSGYDIGEVATTDSARDVPASQSVTGITAGSAVVRLVSSDATVTQTKPILAGALGLEGAKGAWALSHVANDVGTLAADTGSVTFVDADDLTVGTVAAVSPRAALNGIVVSTTADLSAATTLTLAATGDIVSSATSGKAVNLSGASGIASAADITTAGGDVAFNQAVKLTGDVTIDVVDGETTGAVTFAAAVDGTTAGNESLAITGNLVAKASLGGTTALESFAVSGTAALAAGSTIATTGNQTYGGAASSAGSVTVRAAASAVVHFKDAVTLGGLITTATAYDLSLTGSTVTITAPVTFLNTGTVTLGDEATDSLTFQGGLTSTAPSATKLAGTIATSDDDATFGAVLLTAATTVATGSGKAPFQSTVNGAHALAVNASGTTRFAGAVGGTTPLASLVTDAAGTTQLAGGSVTTTGDQTYGDALALGASTTLTGSSVTTLGTLTGNGNALSIAGKAVFGDAAADGVTGVSSLSVTGDALVNTSQVTATVSQTYKAAVTLGTDVAFQAGVVSFEASISGGGNDLQVIGTAVLGDAASDSVTGVDDLTITGSTVLNANTVTTAGTQTYDGAVTATQATAIVLTAAGIDFRQAIDRGEPGIVPSLTIDAGSGGATFAGDAGTTGRPLGAIDVDSKGSVSFAGAIHSTGPVTIASSQGAIVGGATNAIRAPGGTIRLDAATGIGQPTAPIGIEAASVSAATAAGGIYLRAVGSPGNLWIGSDGLKAPGAIGLDAPNAIGVYAGGRIQAGGGVTSSLPIAWSVSTTNDGGAGSLRQVLLNINEVGNANVAGLDARIWFEVVSVASVPAETVFRLTTPLPEIRSAVEIASFSNVVLDGGRTATGGLVFGAASAGSTLQGLTLRNFTGYGVQLVGARNVLVDTVTVQSLRTSTSTGLYATGDLTGTRVVGSTFSGGLRGGLLDGARNLVFGVLGRGNLVTDSRAAPTQPKFSGTGVRAQGDCTGTIIAGNVFTANNYGVGLVNASGLRITGNQFTRNTIAAIYVEGRNLGSSQSSNTFGTGANRNKTNILRFKNGRIG